jgi:hypothetical protein
MRWAVPAGLGHPPFHVESAFLLPAGFSSGPVSVPNNKTIKAGASVGLLGPNSLGQGRVRHCRNNSSVSEAPGGGNYLDEKAIKNSRIRP